MNKSESKYFNTAVRMDEALIALMQKKDFEYITVKELCDKAGVNRSTFYLHYENMADLLEEALQYIMDTFLKCFESDAVTTIEKIKNAPIKELDFITEDYLRHYLEFVKSNSHIYKAVFDNKIYEADKKYKSLYAYIIEPILDRFEFAENERRFIASFYVHGITGIVKEWVEKGCKEDVAEITRLIVQLVKRE